MGRSKSALGFLNGAQLVRRFFVDKRAFKFTLPRGVRRKSMTGLCFARGLNGEQFGGDVADGAFSLFLGLFPARAAERVQRRMRFARANVFADEVRLGHGHIKFRRFITRIGGRVFDDEALGLGRLMADYRWPIARSGGQSLQADKAADAILDVDDEVAFFQFGKINVEGGTGGEGVRRFHPPRPLDFIAPEYFCVRNDDDFGLVAKKTAGERAKVSPKSNVQ